MKNELSYSFRNVSTREEADEIVQLLEDNDLEARIKRDSGDLDSVFQGEAMTNQFEILIQETDNSRAHSLLETAAKKLLKDIDPSYYLFEFTDSELREILVKRDEWNEFDVLLSEKILNDRNVNLNLEKIEEEREIIQAEYKKPQGGQMGWVILGYIAAVLAGFLGLIIGYFIWQAKNKLPSGEKVFAYTKETRSHGKNIFFISAVIFPIVFIYKVVLQFY
ncbi:MAG: hypothetical protein COA38_12740 [Fluviicola sp.]|nr:MAG: hypothetical protein COA38_12740 [Fluviicola sp.]